MVQSLVLLVCRGILRHLKSDVGLRSTCELELKREVG